MVATKALGQLHIVVVPLDKSRSPVQRSSVVRGIPPCAKIVSRQTTVDPGDPRSGGGDRLHYTEQQRLKVGRA